MLQRERGCQTLRWDTGRGAGELFETEWVEEGLCKCPWSLSRVLCSRNKGHWSWDIDLFSWTTSTEMQRISFVAACEFLLMFPGVYSKVTSIWERVWDCFVFFPFPHVQSSCPYKWLHKLLPKHLTVYRRPTSCFDRKPPKTSKRVHTGSKQGCPCCVFITYAKVNHSSMLMFMELPEFFTTVI